MTQPSWSNERILIIPKSILMILGFLILFWALYQVRHIVILVLLACVLASALYPAVNWLESRHLSRGIGIILFYVLFVTVVGGAIFVLSDVIIAQAQVFVRNFPLYLESALEVLAGIPFFWVEEDMANRILDTVETFFIQSATLVSSTWDYAKSFFSGVAGILTILVLAFYLLNDTHHFRQTLIAVLPDDSRDAILKMIRETAQKTGAYVRGQLVLMLMMGVSSWLVLLMLGVPNAEIVGIIYFFLSIIPIIGPLIASGIGALIALAHNPLTALWALLIFFGLELLQNYVLAPKILGRSVRLHPFWVLVSLLAGGSLFGVAGVLLAVPTAVVIRILIQHFYMENHLHRQPEAV